MRIALRFPLTRAHFSEADSITLLVAAGHLRLGYV
jgi:hypothetical protein